MEKSTTMLRHTQKTERQNLIYIYHIDKQARCSRSQQYATLIKFPGHCTDLGQRTPQSDNRVDTACSQQAGGWVWLQTVDYGIVTTEHLHDVGRAPVPDEKRAIVRSGHYVLPVAKTHADIHRNGGKRSTDRSSFLRCQQCSMKIQFSRC